MQEKTDIIASKFLGKKVSGSETYEPSLLVAVPRLENREKYAINQQNLPFEGRDIWHAYEFSAMTEHGIPVTRVLKINYNCNNEYLIESKSLKLYLNSFNMSKFGANIKECLNICKEKIKNDLSTKLKTQVEIEFLDNNSERIEIFNNFQNIMELADENSIHIDKFKESPEVLKCEQTNETKTYYLMFDSLRSNCRITHQPDFGDLFVYYKSKIHLNENSLIQYLSSFRSEYHFHEECCEMIFQRLKDLLEKDDELMVCALYTRRGGIDICPVRWSKNCNFKEFTPLIEITKFARHGIKQ